MNPQPELQLRTFPARVAELGFSAQLPAGWISHELPPDDVDFSDPTSMMPLAFVTAPHATIVFAFAARPAYDDGTLHDWAWYHLNHNQLQPRAIGPDVIAGVAALTGEAVQSSELGPMLVRFAFLEDGDRLVSLSLTAPEMLADSVRTAWFAMLRSFTLETPRGSRFAVGEGAAPTGEPPPAASAPEPILAIPRPERDVPAAPRPNDFARHALADDDATLKEDHPTNANLRDRGAGLVPNVVAADDMEKFAIVAAGAILAQFRVPFGWHVVDDGKRTLVFEPSGAIQISMNLVPREGRADTAILDAIEAQMRSDYPHPEFVRIEAGRIHALGARNIADGSQPLEQYHMLFPGRYDDLVLRARVTSTPDRSTDACDLAELILGSMDFECHPHRDEPRAAAPSGGEPEWWLQALALEARDQLKEAEQLIAAAVPHIGYAASVAEMYRLRMHRLSAAGDHAAARAAYQAAHDWIGDYAGFATSGGEGAALSRERDAFRAQLAAEFGADPWAER